MRNISYFVGRMDFSWKMKIGDNYSLFENVDKCIVGGKIWIIVDEKFS